MFAVVDAHVTEMISSLRFLQTMKCEWRKLTNCETDPAPTLTPNLDDFANVL